MHHPLKPNFDVYLLHFVNTLQANKVESKYTDRLCSDKHTRPPVYIHICQCILLIQYSYKVLLTGNPRQVAVTSCDERFTGSMSLDYCELCLIGFDN